jgi:thiaminase/transcriptional activator TenA
MTDLLWADIAEIYRAICAHPFVTGLTDGSLDHPRFRHYVVQDALYLRGFARALAVCAARAPGEDEVAMFAGHAGAAIAAERQLHAELLAGLGLAAGAAAELPVAPAARAYVADRVGAQASETEKMLMRTHFHTAARYEWMFWDAAYRREGWPV